MLPDAIHNFGRAVALVMPACGALWLMTMRLDMVWLCTVATVLGLALWLYRREPRP